MKTGRLTALSVALCTFVVAVATNAASGLIHQWSGEGDAKDSVGFADGAIINSGATNDDGSVAQDVTFTTGQVGQAFSFDGGGYIDCGTTNVAAFGTNDFSIALWVQTSIGGTVLSKISDGIGYSISINNGHVGCDLWGNDHVAVLSQLRIDDGIFHNVVIERRSADLYVFVDGTIAGKSSSAQVIDMPEVPYVLATNQIPVYDETGTNQVTDTDGNPVVTNEVDVVSQPASFVVGQGFVGLLDEIQLYQRPLTAYEIYSVTHPGVGLAIIDQPLSQHGLAGRSILLHVLAVGVDPITYQWQFNGSDIPGAISNNLVLDTPRTIDSGTYTVIVSNPTGDLTSQAATLTITNLGTPTAGLVARWSGEGTANDSVGGHNGAASNIKYVPGVLGTCFKFDGTSSIRCGNVLGNIGDFTVDFWMQTTATPPDGQYGLPILGQRPYCDAIDLFQLRLMKSGATQTYVFGELGDYRNGYNPAENYITTQSTLTSFHLNDGVFHHIAATRSSNVFSLYIDGTFVTSTPSHDPILLDGAGSFDMGTGVCGNAFTGCLDEVEVFNRALSDSEIYNAYSPDPVISIVRQPLTVSAAENNPAALSVSAAGMDPITYQWRLNGTDIPGATASTYSLASAQLTDAGIYTVVVNNPVGTTISAPAQLNVVPASTILPGLINRWSAEGDFRDSVGGTPYNWGIANFAPGVSGQAWKFDGMFNIVGADYNTGQFGYNDFTWALWIRYEKDGTLLATMPAYRFAATGGQIQVQFGDGSRDFSRDWFIMGDANAGSFQATAPVSIADGNFHHVAVVRQDVTNVLVYIDGTNALQTNMPAFNLADRWGFAFCDDWGRYPRFAGEMDEVEDYNRALTPDEVMSLYTKFANAPRVDSTLQEISASLGKSFTLTAGTISGSGPVTYQWTLNGVPISGATNSTFTVASVDASSAGIYAVTMTTPDGTVSSPTARVSIQLSAGQYNGLFYYDGDVTDNSSGFFTLTLDDSQTFSGSIQQNGHKYPFTGTFSGTTASVTVKRSNLSPLNVTVAGLNSGEITGVVHDATHDVPLHAYSASKSTPNAGNYTLQMVGLSSPNAPNGHSFGNATISSTGSLKFVANLADNTTVSQGSYIANAGMWPLYISAYGGKGSVLGWLSFTNNSGSVCAGTLRWVKSPTPGAKSYKSGFATKMPVIGSTFTAPTSGLGIPLNNSSVVIDAAKIYTPVNAPIVATNANTIQFSQSGVSKTQTLKVSPKTGRFSGNFLNPVTQKLSPVKGIVLQNQGYAAGYFIGTSSNLSGRVTLQRN